MTRKEMIAALEQVERHCPCGARPESPQSHPHVGGCPLYDVLAALRATPEGTPQTAAPVTGCINCGEANDGGYETEEVGSFCEQCWNLLREHFAAALSAAPPASGVSVPVEAVEGITVAGARAFWALKDLEARHEALRVAVMTVVSDPHLEWPAARKALTDALNAEAAPPAPTPPDTDEARRMQLASALGIAGHPTPHWHDILEAIETLKAAPAPTGAPTHEDQAHETTTGMVAAEPLRDVRPVSLHGELRASANGLGQPADGIRDAVQGVAPTGAPASDLAALNTLADDVRVLLKLEPAEAVRRITVIVSDEALAWRAEQAKATGAPADLVAMIKQAFDKVCAEPGYGGLVSSARRRRQVRRLRAKVLAAATKIAWHPAAPALPPDSLPAHVSELEVYGSYILGQQPILVTTPQGLLTAVLKRLSDSPIAEVTIGPRGFNPDAERKVAALPPVEADTMPTLEEATGKRWMIYPDAAAHGDTNDFPVLSVCLSLAEARTEVRDVFGFPCAIYWGTVVSGDMHDEHFVEVLDPAATPGDAP